MMQLWIPIIVLAALAMAFVLLPVLRFRGGVSSSDIEARREKNTELFRERQQELDQDLANGEIDQEQHDKLMHELERGFLRDMEALEREERGGAARRHLKAVPIAGAAAAVVLAIVIYQGWGAGRDLALPDLMERISSAEDEASQREALGELAGFLQARFERLPEDVQNGYMLGTLYLELGRYQDAERVFENLAEQVPAGPDRATVLGQLAQARYLQEERQITPSVQEAMDRALALNPNEFAVMSILAIDAFLKEDVATALEYWRRQLSQVTPGSQQAQALQERIARVQALLPEAQQPVETQVAAGAGASVEVRVEMDPSIADQVSEDMRVFVYARGTDRPVPLAAQSFSVADLPLTVTLDDSAAMTPQFTLSSADQVYVGARISKSGQATAQAGDFEAESEPFEVAEQEEPVTLVIRNQVN